MTTIFYCFFFLISLFFHHTQYIYIERSRERCMCVLIRGGDKSTYTPFFSQYPIFFRRWCESFFGCEQKIQCDPIRKYIPLLFCSGFLFCSPPLHRWEKKWTTGGGDRGLCFPFYLPFYKKIVFCLCMHFIDQRESKKKVQRNKRSVLCTSFSWVGKIQGLVERKRLFDN